MTSADDLSRAVMTRPAGDEVSPTAMVYGRT